jgi:hypothetical protein
MVTAWMKIAVTTTWMFKAIQEIESLMSFPRESKEDTEQPSRAFSWKNWKKHSQGHIILTSSLEKN